MIAYLIARREFLPIGHGRNPGVVQEVLTPGDVAESGVRIAVMVLRTEYWKGECLTRKELWISAQGSYQIFSSILSSTHK